MRKIYIFLVLLLSFFPGLLYAQEIIVDKTEIIKAEVIDVLDQRKEEVFGIKTESIIQTISVKILEGEKKGNIITIDNDYIILKKGQKFFLYHSIDGLNANETYLVRDVDRRPVVISFVALFVIVVLFFSGKQGLRSLAGLAGSFFVILYVLIPGLLNGYPPVITSVLVATIILFFAIYFTHGFNRLSTVAFAGTVLAVIITGVLAYVGVTLSHFTGLVSEEAFYLNLNTRGALDLAGLLLGGIMIGVLGVLDDIAVTQTAVVRELYASASHLSAKVIYKKALSVGREHVGALVNTLALAYTGASLPLLLFFSSGNSVTGSVINQEIFATEIIRTVVGSIGLILTVPITTLLAVYWMKGGRGKATLSHTGHHH